MKRSLEDAANDDDDDDFCVSLTTTGHVWGASGACETACAVWDNLLSLRDGSDRLSALKAECQWAAWPLARQSFWLPADRFR